MKRRRDYLIDAAVDGLPAADVGPWAVEKYLRLGMYADIFSTGMKNLWPTRVYIDLFAGSGHAVLRGSRRRILTSPLIALSVPTPFSKYIFVEDNSSLIAALQNRVAAMAPTASVAYVAGDANEKVPEIASLIPKHSRTTGVLSFCFVDPFGLDVHFETIRLLGDDRAMDFLILLALGMDALRNWSNYLRPSSKKVDRFLGDSTWRDRWKSFEKKDPSPIRFLATEYARSMTGLGYLTTSLEQMLEVRTQDNNMRLYYLAFFSKHDKGYEFWKEVQKYSTNQLGLTL